MATDMKEANILFFLTPKSALEYLEGDSTVRQAIEKMEYHRYNVVAVVDRVTGKYLHSISEGDLLFFLKQHGCTVEGSSRYSLEEVEVHRNYGSVSIAMKMDDLINLIVAQNFVPVTDDKGVFIGIVTRKAVMNYLLSKNPD